MSDPNVEAQAKADKFSAVVLSALTEAARRAAIAYQQRGHLLATWDGSRVEWVAPEEMLRRLGSTIGVEAGVSAAEQGAALDDESAPRAGRK